MEENRSEQEQEPLEATIEEEASPEQPAQENEAEEQPQADEGDVIVLKRSHVLTALVPLAFVLGLAVGFIFWGREQAPTSASADVPAGGESISQAAPQRVNVSAEGAPSLGPDDAAVTIIEFSDFSCPYCRIFHETTFQEILDTYPDDVRFVYQDFPILSRESFFAAQAAQCAHEQGAYWEFHDALFTGGQPLSRQAYEGYAEDLNLDSEDLLACLDEGRYGPLVQEVYQYAAGLGVTGTPTFFINGIPLVGNQPIEQFIQIIEDELN